VVGPCRVRPARSNLGQTLVNPGQTWSNLVKLGQSWSNLPKLREMCFGPYLEILLMWWVPVGSDQLGSGCLVLRADTRENPGVKIGLSLQEDDYLVTKSSDQIFFCCPISILGNKIFYLSPNINLRRRNLYFIATFQNIDYIGRRITIFVA
jgi:hypothetical protein